MSEKERVVRFKRSSSSPVGSDKHYDTAKQRK